MLYDTRPVFLSMPLQLIESWQSRGCAVQGAPENQDYDFSGALRASTHFYSAQRSGALGSGYPVTWRGNSGLDDNPVGGYYLGTSVIFSPIHLPPCHLITHFPQ